MTEVDGAQYNVTAPTLASGFGIISLVTDIDLELLNGTQDYRTKITYMPNVMRYLDTGTSTESIKDLAFAVYWRNRYTGVLTPCLFEPGGSMALKLLLERKY